MKLLSEVREGLKISWSAILANKLRSGRSELSLGF